jgi:O-antigen ligase
LAFIIGCSVYALPFARSKGRLLSLLGACLTLVVVVFLVVRDPDSLERWKETYNTGDLSGRETIYEENFHMILERPLFGWQVGNFNVELGRRLGLPAQRDAHNVWLHLLGQDGLVGTSIFLTGLWFCGLAAWRARQGALGLIPLALFCVINVGSMSITAHITKPFWFILAIAVAALARETRLKVKGTLRHTKTTQLNFA